MGARTKGSGSFASLAPRLLARKGAARPAMRSALGNDLDSLASAQTALGWNDHGEETGSVIQLHRHQIRETPQTRETSPASVGHRAAFTLRLDQERHQRLRLASTLQGCSAQLLVTEALDRFLAEIPQLEAMAAHCKPSSSKA